MERDILRVFFQNPSKAVMRRYLMDKGLLPDQIRCILDVLFPLSRMQSIDDGILRQYFSRYLNVSQLDRLAKSSSRMGQVMRPILRQELSNIWKKYKKQYSTNALFRLHRYEPLVAELLLRHQLIPDLNLLNDYQLTYLHRAILQKDLALFRLLLRHVSPNVIHMMDRDGQTPLDHAIDACSMEMVHLLIKHGGKSCLYRETDLPPLVRAARVSGRCGNLDIFKYLYHLDESLYTRHEMAILAAFIRCQNMEACKYLLETLQKPVPLDTDILGNGIYHLLLEKESSLFCFFLPYAKKEHFLLRNKRGETILHQIVLMSQSAYLRSMDFLRCLLSLRPDGFRLLIDLPDENLHSLDRDLILENVRRLRQLLNKDASIQEFISSLQHCGKKKKR